MDKSIFVRENRKFWSQFKIKNNGPGLLIEESGRPMYLHINAVFAIMINQAKGYTPIWLGKKNSEEYQILKSYLPDVKTAKKQKKWWFLQLYAIFIAIFKFIKIVFTKNIVELSYNGVKYGDIVYDAYLFENKVATIKKLDLKIIKIIAKCIFRHIKIKSILKNEKCAGVLVSHLIGIPCGVMLRCALHYGHEGYLNTAQRQNLVTFQHFNNLEELNYPYKPFPVDVDQTIKRLGQNLEKTFLEVFETQVAGKGPSRDSLTAFSKDNKYYNDRTSFNRDYQLDPSKKNVFIMLHVFNDSPHSHFRWMIFRDFYDWFVQTLEFARKNNKVNWIFKQHPSIKYYVTQDTNFNKLLSQRPNNIVYIDENNQIDTRSLIYCADLIITCVGSTGFELPALNAIPSITAGDNPYANLGFAIEPKTKKEYFEILNKADKIEKLTHEAQQRAQAAYVYIKKFSKVKFHVYPHLSESEEKNRSIDEEYWSKILNQYSTKNDVILKELSDYIKEIAKPDFKRLTS